MCGRALPEETDLFPEILPLCPRKRVTRFERWKGEYDCSPSHQSDEVGRVNAEEPTEDKDTVTLLFLDDQVGDDESADDDENRYRIATDYSQSHRPGEAAELGFLNDMCKDNEPGEPATYALDTLEQDCFPTVRFGLRFVCNERRGEMAPLKLLV